MDEQLRRRLDRQSRLVGLLIFLHVVSVALMGAYCAVNASCFSTDDDGNTVFTLNSGKALRFVEHADDGGSTRLEIDGTGAVTIYDLGGNLIATIDADNLKLEKRLQVKSGTDAGASDSGYTAIWSDRADSNNLMGTDQLGVDVEFADFLIE